MAGVARAGCRWIASCYIGSDTFVTHADHTTLRGGPEVEFKTMFPAAGNYRIWTQFQRAGRVTTVFFTVRVVA